MLESKTARTGLHPMRARRGLNGPAGTIAQAALPGYPTTHTGYPDTSSAPDLASVAANAYADARALALDLHNARDAWAMRALGVALALRDLAGALHRDTTDGQEGKRW